MPHPLERKIAEGEHQHQDFKFRIDDSKKIARTLSAFANTEGGRLLIGVKDNGKIAGISPDEEFYMIEAAAQIYNKPAIPFETSLWDIDGKTVMEITIQPSENKPHLAVTDSGKWMAFIRHQDTNHPASIVHLNLWKLSEPDKEIPRTFALPEEKILKALRGEEYLTLNQITKTARINRFDTIKGLAKLIIWNLVGLKVKGSLYQFYLNPEL